MSTLDVESPRHTTLPGELEHMIGTPAVFWIFESFPALDIREACVKELETSWPLNTRETVDWVERMILGFWKAPLQLDTFCLRLLSWYLLKTPKDFRAQALKFALGLDPRERPHPDVRNKFLKIIVDCCLKWPTDSSTSPQLAVPELEQFLTSFFHRVFFNSQGDEKRPLEEWVSMERVIKIMVGLEWKNPTLIKLLEDLYTALSAQIIRFEDKQEWLPNLSSDLHLLIVSKALALLTENKE